MSEKKYGFRRVIPEKPLPRQEEIWNFAGGTCHMMSTEHVMRFSDIYREAINYASLNPDSFSVVDDFVENVPTRAQVALELVALISVGYVIVEEIIPVKAAEIEKR